MEYITTAEQAERNAARRMRELGYTDAKVTRSGADGGLDVVSSRAIAQVKWKGAQVSRPDLQRLYGARGSSHHRTLLFFAASSYSSHAVAYGDSVDMQLFIYDPLGALTPVNAAAQEAMRPSRNALGNAIGLSPAQSAKGAADVTSHKQSLWNDGSIGNALLLLSLFAFLGGIGAYVDQDISWFQRILFGTSLIVMAIFVARAGYRRLRKYFRK